MIAPRLRARWDAVRSSYWFVPSLMAVAAAVLAFVTTTVDIRLGADWLDGTGWLFAHQPAGARAVLSTIAGSMITVAGVTFSITIAAVSYASGQFGPRILANFMRDRGNQVTLGTFIATFLYGLLVLRSVRSPEEMAPGMDGGAAGFVPQISVLVAIALGIASIGVLIYFIHHVPDRLHLPNIVAVIGRELDAHLEHHRYPTEIGRTASDADGAADLPFAVDDAARLFADGTGYLQHVDEDRLLDLARERDLVLRLACRPGDFVHAAAPLLLAWPAARADDACLKALREAFAWGRQRTYAQDLLFLVDELVEIAARALSPGVNDPFTATNCMDWLSHALVRSGARPDPDPHRYDDDGRLRIITRTTTFEVVAERAVAQLLPYAAADRNAALHLMKVLADAVGALDREAPRLVLLEHARALSATARPADPRDRAALDERLRVLARLARDPADRDALGVHHRWLGGSA